MDDADRLHLVTPAFGGGDGFGPGDPQQGVVIGRSILLHDRVLGPTNGVHGGHRPLWQVVPGTQPFLKASGPRRQQGFTGTSDHSSLWVSNDARDRLQRTEVHDVVAEHGQTIINVDGVGL
ncbi:hypothetical protein D3C87_1399350 [compost metagenome]